MRRWPDFVSAQFYDNAPAPSEDQYTACVERRRQLEWTPIARRSSEGRPFRRRRQMPNSERRTVNGERHLNAARLDLRSITIENHVENLLTGNDAISRVVDVSVGADNRDAKVSDAVGISHRTRIR